MIQKKKLHVKLCTRSPSAKSTITLLARSFQLSPYTHLPSKFVIRRTVFLIDGVIKISNDDLRSSTWLTAYLVGTGTILIILEALSLHCCLKLGKGPYYLSIFGRHCVCWWLRDNRRANTLILIRLEFTILRLWHILVYVTFTVKELCQNLIDSEAFPRWHFLRQHTYYRVHNTPRVVI